MTANAPAPRTRLVGTIDISLPLRWQLVGGLIGGLVMMALVFASTVQFSKTIDTPAVLTPEGGILRLTSARPGWVKSIFVKEGQKVAAGAPIAAISSETADQAGRITQRLVLNSFDAQTRVLARQIASSTTALQATLQSLEARGAGLRSRLAGIEGRLRLQEKLIAGARTEFERAAEIASRGFVSRREIAEREDVLSIREQQLAQISEERASVLADLSELDAERRRLKASAKSDADRVLIGEIELDRARAVAGADDGQLIIAPLDGEIAALHVVRGQPVSAGEAVSQMVPVGGRLVAHLRIPIGAAGFVATGQEVRLALDAYPFERFGMLPGRIVSISSAPLPHLGGARQEAPEYGAVAIVASQGLRLNGRILPVRAGMTATARIVTERRSLAGWLLKPGLAAITQ